MDYTPQYPVPKDLIFDSGHLERILIALLSSDIDLSICKPIQIVYIELITIEGNYLKADSTDLLSALDEAISTLPDNLRWKFFEEYDKTSHTSTKNS